MSRGGSRGRARAPPFAAALCSSSSLRMLAALQGTPACLVSRKPWGKSPVDEPLRVRTAVWCMLCMGLMHTRSKRLGWDNFLIWFWRLQLDTALAGLMNASVWGAVLDTQLHSESALAAHGQHVWMPLAAFGRHATVVL